MADTKISALTDGVAASATDKIPVARQTGTNAYLTPAYISNFVAGVSPDVTTIRLVDDFVLGGQRAPGDGYPTIGELGWSLYLIGTDDGSNSTFGTAAIPNPGIFNLSTIAATNAGLGLVPLVENNLGNLSTNANWIARWVFKLPTTADFPTTHVSLGLITSTPDSFSSGAFLRYNGATDTKYTFVTSFEGTSTASTANSVIADTAFHTLQIRSLTAGSVLFSLDGGTETTLSTNLPGVVGPAAVIVNTGSSSKTLLVDYFSFYMTGLAR